MVLLSPLHCLMILNSVFESYHGTLQNHECLILSFVHNLTFYVLKYWSARPKCFHSCVYGSVTPLEMEAYPLREIISKALQCSK